METLALRGPAPNHIIISSCLNFQTSLLSAILSNILPQRHNLSYFLFHLLIALGFPEFLHLEETHCTSYPK